MGKETKEDGDMYKTDMSRRSLIAGSAGAVMATFVATSFGFQQPLAAENGSPSDSEELIQVDQPDGWTEFEQFKSSGLL